MQCFVLERETEACLAQCIQARFRKRSLKIEIKIIMWMHTDNVKVPVLQKKKKSLLVFIFDAQNMLKLLKYVI